LRGSAAISAGCGLLPGVWACELAPVGTGEAHGEMIIRTKKIRRQLHGCHVNDRITRIICEFHNLKIHSRLIIDNMEIL